MGQAAPLVRLSQGKCGADQQGRKADEDQDRAEGRSGRKREEPKDCPRRQGTAQNPVQGIGKGRRKGRGRVLRGIRNPGVEGETAGLAQASGQQARAAQRADAQRGEPGDFANPPGPSGMGYRGHAQHEDQVRCTGQREALHHGLRLFRIRDKQHAEHRAQQAFPEKQHQAQMIGQKRAVDHGKADVKAQREQPGAFLASEVDGRVYRGRQEQDRRQQEVECRTFRLKGELKAVQLDGERAGKPPGIYPCGKAQVDGAGCERKGRQSRSVFPDRQGGEPRGYRQEQQEQQRRHLRSPPRSFGQAPWARR